jgi:hypothetical protein
MDPMQGQQPPPPMMAANGGLMNINLPDDYYDEDSYAHGGIAHFNGEDGSEVGFLDSLTYDPARGASAIAAWAKENPVDAVSLGLMFVPGVGWTAAAGLKGLTTLGKLAAPIAKKYGPKAGKLIVDGISKAFTKVNPARNVGPTLPGVANRVFDPLKSMFTTGVAATGVGKAIDYFGTPDDFNEYDPNAPVGAKPPAKPPVEPQPAGLPQPPAPKGLAQLQEVDMSTMPTRTPEKVDYMAKAKEYFAGVLPSGMTDEEMAKDKEQRGYEALTQFGLNLANTKNPSFLGSVGEAGAATMPAIIEARTAQNAAMATRKKEDRDTKIAQIQTALGLEKDDAEKVFKQQELALKKQEVALQDKLTNAQIGNLGKPDNIYDLMESNPALAEKIIGLQQTGQMTESVAVKTATIIAQNNPEFFNMPPETQVNYINDLKTSLMAGSGSGSQSTPSEKSTKVGRFDMETL